MSTTVDVFIKFDGSKRKLIEILADDFLINIDKEAYWFLTYIEIGLSQRKDDLEYFVGHQFRPYNFVVGGTTYAWSSCLGTVRNAHPNIMDILAQALAIKLRTRTMIYSEDLGIQRRYRHVRSMKRNRFSKLLDEKTGRPPKGYF